ncbi:Transcriptional regulatory protein OmpR [bacterium HR39]|nr:Transcriptional regulatory protein OmpR [bacterium HR39]
MLRRANSLPPARERQEFGRFRFAEWTYDAARRELVRGDGLTVPLSAAEGALLVAFLRHPGVVLDRERLLDLARGRDLKPFDRSIDNLVSRLRRKLGDDPRRSRFVRTERGGGYTFVAPVERLA